MKTLLRIKKIRAQSGYRNIFESTRRPQESISEKAVHVSLRQSLIVPPLRGIEAANLFSIAAFWSVKIKLTEIPLHYVTDKDLCDSYEQLPTFRGKPFV